jgi:hypothetical protein
LLQMDKGDYQHHRDEATEQVFWPYIQHLDRWENCFHLHIPPLAY